MADVKMPESVPCGFDEKGWAPCKKPSTNGWCSEHEKAECVSCGEHAVRSCDAGMGGLSCGVSLCSSCQHSMEGSNHVTAQVYEIQSKEEHELMTTGKESARMLALRGVPIHVPLPSNLEELLSKKWEGIFDLKICYFLRIKHGCMGNFPAILKDTRVAIITPDKGSLIRVWRSLSPMDSEIVADSWMVNEEIGVGYHMSANDWERKQSRPHKIFGKEEIESLLEKDPSSFKWAPGLIGARVHQERFEELINRAVA